jgi:CRISPR/Cas system-associated exonuclease Cas4 (RecB family)
MRHISFSQIKMFNQCPVWWDAVYNKGMKTEAGKYAQIGSAIHEYISKGEWGKEYDPGVILEAQNILEGFDLSLIPESNDGKEIEIRKNINGEVEFLGYIDMLEGNTIIDWKTNYLPNADPLQLSIYAWLAHEELIPWEDEIIGKFIYLRTNTVQTFKFNWENFEQTKNFVYTQVQKMLHPIETFQEKPGPYCAYCPLLEQCSKSLDIISQYKLTQMRLKQIQEELKKTVEDKPLITEGGIAKMAPIERMNFNKKKIAELDMPLPTTLDTKAIKADESLMKQLEEMGAVKKSIYYKMAIE